MQKLTIDEQLELINNLKERGMDDVDYIDFISQAENYIKNSEMYNNTDPDSIEIQGYETTNTGMFLKRYVDKSVEPITKAQFDLNKIFNILPQDIKSSFRSVKKR